MIPKIVDHGGHAEVRHEGRTVKITLYVNTTEDENDLAVRVGDYIKESGCCPMVVGAGLLLDKNMAEEFWKLILRYPREAAKEKT